MGDSIIKFITKFVVIILITFLVLSFAISGIGGALQNTRSDVVASVGELNIGGSSMRRAVARDVNRIRNNYGIEITDELAKMIENSVMERMINRLMILQDGDDLGIKIGKNQIMNIIKNDQSFHDDKGNFSKEMFEAILRNNGETEQSFVRTIQDDIANDLLMSVITQDIVIPSTLVNKLQAYQGQGRKVDMLTISAKQVGKIAPPSQEQLKKYYETERDNFKSPQYRSADYISVSAKNVEDEIDVSQPTLRAYYDDNIDEFTVSDAIDLGQMLFTSQADAQNAYKDLISGQEFGLVAAQKALQNNDSTFVGLKKRDDLIEDLSDENIELLFKAREDGQPNYTAPIKGKIGWFIYQVKKLIPEHVKSFKLVEKSIKNNIIEQQAGDILYQLTGNIEDEISAGSSLQEIASKFRLSLKNTGDIDASGLDSKGQKVDNLPEFSNFVNNIFTIKEGEISDVISSDDGLKFYLQNVKSITAPRDRKLQEVRDQVIAAWKQTQLQEELFKLANTTADDIAVADDKVQEMTKKAQSLNINVQKDHIIYRSGETTTSPDLINEAFALKIGEAGKALQNQDDSYSIIVVKNDINAEIDDPKYGVAAVKSALKSNLENEMVEQYIAHLRAKYPVEYKNR